MPLERADLVVACDLALAGKSNEAHAIVRLETRDVAACWIHAVLHKQAGEPETARKWYASAGQFYESYSDARAELAAIKATLTY